MTTFAGHADHEPFLTVTFSTNPNGGFGQVVVTNADGTPFLTPSNMTFSISSCNDPLPLLVTPTPQIVASLFGDALCNLPTPPQQQPPEPYPLALQAQQPLEPYPLAQEIPAQDIQPIGLTGSPCPVPLAWDLGI